LSVWKRAERKVGNWASQTAAVKDVLMAASKVWHSVVMMVSMTAVRMAASSAASTGENLVENSAVLMADKKALQVAASWAVRLVDSRVFSTVGYLVSTKAVYLGQQTADELESHLAVSKVRCSDVKTVESTAVLWAAGWVVWTAVPTDGPTAADWASPRAVHWDVRSAEKKVDKMVDTQVARWAAWMDVRMADSKVWCSVVNWACHLVAGTEH
jgi:hypothetical protein